MARVYAVESNYSLTGAIADHRLPVRSEFIKPILLGLEQYFLRGNPSGVAAAVLSDPKVGAFVTSLAEDLSSNRGRGLVAVGYRQPPDVHALVARINDHLANSDRAVQYTVEPDASRPHHVADIAELITDMNADKVETLLILGGNPAYKRAGGSRLCWRHDQGQRAHPSVVLRQ